MRRGSGSYGKGADASEVGGELLAEDLGVDDVSVVGEGDAVATGSSRGGGHTDSW